VVLLVDATQNIQAQTVAHFQAAKKLNLPIIPVINKIDLPNADSEKVAQTLVDTFGTEKSEIIYISAKTGENVELVLKAIIEKIPSPTGDVQKPLRSLIFDAVYDTHRGVVALVRLFDGSLSKGEKITFLGSHAQTSVIEVGTFSPFPVAVSNLTAGDIGYVMTGVKDIRLANVGDTITMVGSTGVQPLPGYEKPKPMVFFGVYPKHPEEFGNLKEGLSKLALADASLSYSEEYSAFLGSGFRVGFLGLLHAEI